METESPDRTRRKVERVRQVGLLGGSFDPVHPAHIALARVALEAFHLDEVRFLPCAQQALKTHRPASPEDRCAMLRLAVADDPRLTIEASEVLRGGKTYTYDTLMALRRREPGVHFWFILGMDSVREFSRWYKARELLELCSFIVFDRPGVEPPANVFDSRLLLHRLHEPCLDSSSSDIRASVATGASIRYPTLQLVEAYFRAHALYA